MKTIVKTIHEEGYSDDSKTLGVLLNFTEDQSFNESFIFLFKHDRKIYMFFNTMVDMFNYMLNGTYAIKIAYMEEEDFDKLYDAKFIEGKFADQLKWI